MERTLYSSASKRLFQSPTRSKSADEILSREFGSDLRRITANEREVQGRETGPRQAETITAASISDRFQSGVESLRRNNETSANRFKSDPPFRSSALNAHTLAARVKAMEGEISSLRDQSLGGESFILSPSASGTRRSVSEISLEAKIVRLEGELRQRDSDLQDALIAKEKILNELDVVKKKNVHLESELDSATDRAEAEADRVATIMEQGTIVSHRAAHALDEDVQEARRNGEAMRGALERILAALDSELALSEMFSDGLAEDDGEDIGTPFSNPVSSIRKRGGGHSSNNSVSFSVPSTHSKSPRAASGIGRRSVARLEAAASAAITRLSVIVADMRDKAAGAERDASSTVSRADRHREDVTNLQLKLSEAEVALTEGRSEFERAEVVWRKKIDVLQSQNQKSQEHIEQLSKLVTINSKSGNENEIISASVRRAESAEARLASTELRVEELEISVVEMATQMDSCLTLLKSRHGELAELREKCGRLEGEKSTLESSMRSYEERLLGASFQTDTYTRGLQLENSKISAELDVANSKIKQFETQLTQAESHRRAAEGAVLLEKKIIELENELVSERRNAGDISQRSKSGILDSKTELEIVQRRLDASNRHNNDLELEISKLKNISEEHSSNVRQLSAAISRQVELNTELENSKKREVSLQRELASADATKKLFEKVREDFLRVEAEKIRLEEEAVALRGENIMATRKVLDLEERVTEAERTSAKMLNFDELKRTLQEKVFALESDLSVCESKNINLLKDKEFLEGRVAVLEKALRRAEEEIENLKKELIKREREREDSVREWAQRESSLSATIETERSRLKNAVERMETALGRAERAETREGQASEQVEILTKKIMSAEGEVTRAKERELLAKKTAEAADLNTKRIKSKLEDVEKTVEEAEIFRREMMMKMRDLETNLSSVENRERDSVAKLQEAEKKLKKLSAEEKQLTAELKAAQEAEKKFIKRVEEAESRMAEAAKKEKELLQKLEEYEEEERAASQRAVAAESKQETLQQKLDSKSEELAKIAAKFEAEKTELVEKFESALKSVSAAEEKERKLIENIENISKELTYAENGEKKNREEMEEVVRKFSQLETALKKEKASLEEEKLKAQSLKEEKRDLEQRLEELVANFESKSAQNQSELEKKLERERRAAIEKLNEGIERERREKLLAEKEAEENIRKLNERMRGEMQKLEKENGKLSESVAALSKVDVVLEKGEAFLMGRNVREITVGLGWDSDEGCDLDASIAAFEWDGSHIEDIYFGHKQGVSGAIMHNGDNVTGSLEGDDESISILMHKLPKRCAILFVTVNIYNRAHGHDGEADISNAYCRILVLGGRKELMRYPIKPERGHWSSVVMCAFHREGETWKLTAIGETANGKTIRDIRPVLKNMIIEGSFLSQKGAEELARKLQEVMRERERALIEIEHLKRDRVSPRHSPTSPTNILDSRSTLVVPLINPEMRSPALPLDSRRMSTGVVRQERSDHSIPTYMKHDSTRRASSFASSSSAGSRRDDDFGNDPSTFLQGY